MLKIENLEFRYQFRKIFSGLNFHSEPGQGVHIIGANGAGKSTLMSVIAGLRREHQGRISFVNRAGILIEDRREALEYLPAEANSLYGKRDAMENLRFWTGLRGLSYTEAELIAELQFWDLSHPLVRQHFPIERFSTGMKRRLALARVRLSQTDCWLLDEPLYGLDTRGIDRFQEMLQQHFAKGGEAWIVSHDQVPLSRFSFKSLDLKKEQAR